MSENDLNINITNNIMNELNMNKRNFKLNQTTNIIDSENYKSENNLNFENALSTNYYNNNMNSENNLNFENALGTNYHNNNMNSENNLNFENALGTNYHNNNMNSENNLNFENALSTNYDNNNNMNSENNLINLNFEKKISSNIIMSKARQINTKYLNTLVNKISKKIKNEEITNQAKKVTNLYGEGYIVNTTSAQNILLKMLAGVPYKKEYDKVIPKAETHKEIQQPPNIGTRHITRLRKEKKKYFTRLKEEEEKNKKIKLYTPPPGSLTLNIQMDENSPEGIAHEKEIELWDNQRENRNNKEGAPPSEKYILKVILYCVYNDLNEAHKKLKSKYGKLYFDTHTGEMKRIKYVQKVMIVYIEVKCYEHNFKYGSDKNLLEKYKQKIVERLIQQEYIDYHMIYDILLTNKRKNAFDETSGDEYDALYLLDYIKEKDYTGPKYNILEIESKDNTNNKFICSRFMTNKINFEAETLKQALECKNYIENECWITTLMNYYGDSILSQDRSIRYRLTREKLLIILNTNESKIKNGLKIKDIVPFFQKFNLILKVFDFTLTLIYQYIPPRPNKHEPVCYAYINGNHVYTIDQNHHSLKFKKLFDLQTDAIIVKPPTSNYNLNFDKEPSKVYLMKNVDDMFNIIKEFHKFVQTFDFISYDNNLIEVYILFRQKYNYKPMIKFQGGRITFLFLSFKNIKIKIQSQDLDKELMDSKSSISVDCEKVYNNLATTFFNFKKNIFLPNHKSHYTELDIDILDEYRTHVSNGLINTIENKKNLLEIDISKAFTYALSQIKKIPIFCEFDIFEKYNGQQIKPLNLYIVENKNVNLFFNQKYCLCYGQFINTISDIKILAVKTPRFIKEVKYKQLVDELYKTNISNDIEENKKLKKQICNVTVGLLGKSINKSSKSHVFDSASEAYNYKHMCDAVYHTISKIEEVEIDDEEEKISNEPILLYYINYDAMIEAIKNFPNSEYLQTCEINNETVWKAVFYKREISKTSKAYMIEIDNDEDREQYNNIYKNVNTKTYSLISCDSEGNEKKVIIQESQDTIYHVLTSNKETKLMNGYRYIHELLLQYHNHKIYTDAKMLTDNNIKIYSVKTDAFTIDKSNIEIAKNLLKFSLNIGGWRISETKNIKVPLLPFKMNKNFEINIPENKIINKIDVVDEYDKNELCEHFIENKRVIVRAKYAGSGKSSACAHMQALGYTPIFICPTNRLVKEHKDNKITSATINMFFGFGINEENQYIKQFDASEFDCIVFDEIYFYSVENLRRIYKYCLNNPDKIILATGDINQLESIESVSNVSSYDEYMNQCINMIFPNEIYLKENKRLKTKEDKTKLENIYDDIFYNSLTIPEIIKKHNFKTTNKVISDNNIAYTHKTCNLVSQKVRTIQGRHNKYEIDEMLICKKYYKYVNKNNNGKIKTMNINKNCEYKIIGVYDDYIMLTDETNNKFDITVDIIEKHFTYSYCCTCHSLQGSSKSGIMTIHEWNHFFVDKNWFYTAITRARNLDDVYFMMSNKQSEDTEYKLLRKYFIDKKEGYIQQDYKNGTFTQPGQEFKSNYINIDWFFTNIKKHCGSCGCDFSYSLDGSVKSDLTAQRLDNNLPHNLDNIIPMCVNCNRSISDHHCKNNNAPAKVLLYDYDDEPDLDDDDDENYYC